MILEKEKPILTIKSDITFWLIGSMVISSGFGLYLIVHFWPQHKGQQLFLLLFVMSLIFIVLIFVYKLLIFLVNRKPVIVCWEEKMVVNGKLTIPYIQIFRIIQEKTIKSKSYDLYLIIQYEFGNLEFNEFYMEGGYSELKAALQKNEASKNIAFEQKEIDHTFWGE